MNQPDIEPLFILGAPRSGTSLLYRTLALHPDAAWISNYGRRLPALPEVAVLNRIARRARDQRQRVWFGENGDNAYRYGVARGAVERLFPQPVEGEPVFERRAVLQGLDRTGCGPHQLRLRNDVRRLVRASGARVLVSKRIGHNRRVGLLHEIFPDARFVVVSRDGRAVARSLLAVDWWPDTHVWWFGGTPREWARAGGDPRDLAAHHWVREVGAIEAGLAVVPAHQVRRISYEQLVAAPREVITEVAEFAGLDGADGWQADLARVRFPNRNAVADADERVAAIQTDTLRSLGYVA